MYPSQLLKGTYQTIILDLLSKHGKMYGYELSQLVKECSEGEVSLPEGSLYPILHKMAEEGLVTVEKIEIGRRVRRYYTLTSAGVEQAKFKTEEFNRFVQTMALLLKPKLT
ncbi:MAG: PadR family transcriptional regulator [Cyclobacteriaceae bacterium]